MLRIRSTYLYLAVALGLFCYIYFIDVKIKSTDESTRSQGLLYSFNADDINWLQVTNASGTVLLEKKEGHWKITKPVQALPENGVVQQILSELEFVRSQRTMDYSTLPGAKDETIKQWNLNPPVVRVEFRTAKEDYLLQIGRNVALTQNVYARASDKTNAPVYIINSAIKSIMDKGLTDLRSRSVLDFDYKEIAQCSVREFTNASLISRDVEADFDKDKNLWSLKKPIVARADKSRVEAWMRQLQDLRVSQFVSDDNTNLSTYGLSSPAAQITVEKPGGGEDLSLLIGTVSADKPNEVYAKRLKNNSVFTLNKESVDKLIAGLSDSRDKKLLAINVPDVNRIIIEQKGKPTLSLTKQNGNWLLDGEAGAVAESGKVLDMLNYLAALQAVQFVKDSATDLHSYGLDKPASKVTLQYSTGKDGKDSASVDILLGKVDKQPVFAMTSAEPFIYSLPATAFDIFPKDMLSWRSLQVIQVEEDKLKQVEISGKDIPSVTLVRDNGGYKSAIAGQKLDATNAGTIINVASNLRAVQWLGKPIAAYALDKPIMRVVVAGDSTSTVRVGAILLSGARAAQIEGQPYVFELGLPAFNALTLNPIAASKASAPEVAPVPVEPPPAKK